MYYTAAIGYRSGKREERNVSLWVSVGCCVVMPLCNVASDMLPITEINRYASPTRSYVDTTSNVNVCQG